MKLLVLLLLLAAKASGESMPFFFTDSFVEYLNNRGASGGDDGNNDDDKCQVHKTCGACATTPGCTWCPKFGDNQCHSAYSKSTTCEPTEVVWSPDGCAPLPTGEKKPIVILPGLIGSNLEARSDSDGDHNRPCRRKSSWFTLWLSSFELLPKAYPW